MKSVLTKLALVAVLLAIAYPAFIHLGLVENRPGRLVAEQTGLSLGVLWSRLYYDATGNPSVEARELFDRGLSAGELGEWPKAAYYFREASHHAPKEAGYHYALAKAHQYAGNPAGAAIHMMVYSHEDLIAGQSPETLQEISDRLNDLQTTSSELLDAAWNIASALPHGSPARAQVIRAAVRSSDWDILYRILDEDPAETAPYIAALGAELAQEGRITESGYAFTVANDTADASAIAAAPYLCAHKRIAPVCEFRIVREGVMGLPAITEQVCEEPTRFAFGRDEEHLQLQGMTLMAIAMEEAAAGRSQEAMARWTDGASRVEQSRIGYLCDGPEQLSELYPVPPNQSMSGGWSYSEPEIIKQTVEPPSVFEIAPIEWTSDTLSETVAVSRAMSIYLGAYERPLLDEIESLRASLDIEDLPGDIARLAEEYAALRYDILDPYYVSLHQRLYPDEEVPQ